MATVQTKKSFSAQRSSMVGGAGSSGGRVLRIHQLKRWSWNGLRKASRGGAGI